MPPYHESKFIAEKSIDKLITAIDDENPLSMSGELNSRKFSDTPDYDKLRNVLYEIALDLAVPLDDCLWDWENNFEYLSIYNKENPL
uniref:Uncharacterized protein n=1 Tax=Romanomermis culicivorax TaxID=13658 RepID=A0A915JLM2_ROMCU